MKRTAALAGALALFAACGAQPRPNVLLITVDTWRADRLSFGRASSGQNGEPLTPELDRLAAEGVVFARATSPRARTTPAIATLLTGLYPHEHGARDLLVPLAPTIPRLPERLRDAGWSTAAIVSNYVLKDDLSGLRLGFESWDETLPDRGGVPPEDVPERRARATTDAALALVGLERDGLEEPWFVWIHYMDPHGAYQPPPEHAPSPVAPRWIAAQSAAPETGAASRPGVHRWIADYNVPPEARDATGRIDAARVTALYDAEVRYADAQIGRLLARLREAGQLERTLVVLTADHGESLGEEEYWFEHGRSVSQATVHVPLVVRWPNAIAEGPAPRVSQADAGLADVAPTVLELLGLEPLAAPDALRGASLLTALCWDEALPRAVYAERVERAPRAGAVLTKSARIGDWKRVRRWAARNDAPAPLEVVSDELYDVARDPREERDLYANPPHGAPMAELDAALARYAAADPLLDPARAGRELETRGGEEARRVLRALGY